MARVEHVVEPQPLLRLRVLLVLGLLAGLFGMHALAPGGLQTPEHPSVAAGHGSQVASVQDECGPGGHGGCHGTAEHADAACSSGAVGSGLALTAPAPALDGLAPVPEAACASSYDTPDGARAPPSLAELQLLRI